MSDDAGACLTPTGMMGRPQPLLPHIPPLHGAPPRQRGGRVPPPAESHVPSQVLDSNPRVTSPSNRRSYAGSGYKPRPFKSALDSSRLDTRPRRFPRLARTRPNARCAPPRVPPAGPVKVPQRQIGRRAAGWTDGPGCRASRGRSCEPRPGPRLERCRGRWPQHSVTAIGARREIRFGGTARSAADK